MPLGVESSHVARDFAQRFVGVIVVTKPIDQIEDCKAAHPLNILIFSRIKENIVDLQRVFHTIQCLVDPLGFILMDTPNIPFARGTHIYHPYCFSPTTLKRLFGCHGISIVKIISTGRPSSILLPKYVTLLARRETEKSAQCSKSIPSARMAGPCIALGRSWRGLIETTPLNWIDSIIASNRFRLRHAETDRLKTLLATRCVSAN